MPKPASVYPDPSIIETELVKNLRQQFALAVERNRSLGRYQYENFRTSLGDGLAIFWMIEVPCLKFFTRKKKKILATLAIVKSDNLAMHSSFSLRCECNDETIENFLLKFMEEFSDSSSFLEFPAFYRKKYL